MALWLHAEKVDCVSVGERLHLNPTIVFNEGNSLQSCAVVHMGVDTCDGFT